MSDFFVAVGLAIAIEGMLYALFPEGMKKMMMQVLAMPSASVRTAGITAAMIGVALVWLVRGAM
ncbi:conserved hypothetical protein [Candidatus Terasakiella magnetica]|uniref:DUF2065 domain-containing protein n=1 Tax=Candidatus Terasakiella magnetica TaxID=1867952 RepID=A0A1C3RH50_9PROT|nr:DUF2065 domain-containing protein [Candidatus Terasakiella magnetica]SCA56504.1 conserved hypothetical protein [Candidatus Terasakiella magnetica]